jgi:hypothetical protein
MSIGNSGRIVIEVEPEAKRRLYAALVRDGLTLKDWFLKNAEIYLAESEDTQLPKPFPQVKEEAIPDGASKSVKSSSRAKTQ